jgi:LCP family protein required for cell wall assembly
MLKRFAIAAVAIVLLSTATTASALLLELDKDAAFLEQNARIKVTPGILDDVDAGNAKTIMVLGSDKRLDEGKKAASRSDTVMLVRMDPDKGATSVMSLPRDLKVTIRGATDKLNAAYAYGGEELTIQTVKNLLKPHSPTGKFPISHVVNINFGGFQRAVNYFDCMYIDVDKEYFNDNSGFGENYATIDVPAGYQRLCGEDSLDYVRYRHGDSDLVRGARQQEYLRQAKAQVGIGELVDNKDQLLKIFGRYTTTDIRGSRQVLSLLKLTLNSSKKPLREIQFPAAETGSFVTATEGGLDRAVKRFMNADLGTGAPKTPVETEAEAKKSSKKTKKKKQRQQSIAKSGVVIAKQEGEDQAIALATKVAMPVLFPKVKTPLAQYMADQSRSYILEDRQNHKFPSYRIVVKTRDIGQYYGIQGTKWENPPILEEEDEVRKIKGREFRIYKDGNRIRIVALKTKNGSYWVSNTLSQSLSNAQMLAIARTLGPIGSK